MLELTIEGACTYRAALLQAGYRSSGIWSTPGGSTASELLVAGKDKRRFIYHPDKAELHIERETS